MNEEVSLGRRKAAIMGKMKYIRLLMEQNTHCNVNCPTKKILKKMYKCQRWQTYVQVIYKIGEKGLVERG